jgi:signal transduction histidine kinase
LDTGVRQSDGLQMSDRVAPNRGLVAVDFIVAAVVTALQVANWLVAVPLLSFGGPAERIAQEPNALALAVLGGVCLLWRRRSPLPVLIVAGASSCIYLASGFPAGRPLAPAIALLTLSRVSSALFTAVAGTAMALCLNIAVWIPLGWEGEDLDDRVLDNLLLLSLACLLGWGIQLGRARTSALRDQAVRLSREHTIARERALQQEKSRIAREMHDVVAHHVSVITAQAAGAQRVFDTQPELARQALAAIETTGRGALTEMRRVLGLLHPGAASALLDPPPTLDQLPSLLARTERAGVPVRLSITGSPSELPSGMELNAYRIVQEALTNTLKHAGASRALVELHYGAGSLQIRISDDGRGLWPDSPSSGPGRGLIGMRERVALHGGDLRVGTGADGGVEIFATLPFEAGGAVGPWPAPHRRRLAGVRLTRMESR